MAKDKLGELESFANAVDSYVNNLYDAVQGLVRKAKEAVAEALEEAKEKAKKPEEYKVKDQGTLLLADIKDCDRAVHAWVAGAMEDYLSYPPTAYPKSLNGTAWSNLVDAAPRYNPYYPDYAHHLFRWACLAGELVKSVKHKNGFNHEAKKGDTGVTLYLAHEGTTTDVFEVDFTKKDNSRTFAVRWDFSLAPPPSAVFKFVYSLLGHPPANPKHVIGGKAGG